jgi:hypothetical protein
VSRVLDEDELIEHWTLVGGELNLLTADLAIAAARAAGGRHG